jgi:hypothetical protein
MVNRVQDYYETAVKFLALPPMARFVIATSFALVQYEEFILNEEEMSDMIFLRVIEKNKYDDFRFIVMNHRLINGNIGTK